MAQGFEQNTMGVACLPLSLVAQLGQCRHLNSHDWDLSLI